MSVVGVLHPGEMGAAVGRCLAEAGHAVLWASDGRSAATAGRARDFRDAGTARALAAQADVIISVCPPHAAVDVAREVSGFGGVYVDANAVAPATARQIGALVSGAFVDGGIVGLPPTAPDQTRFYLAGDEAESVAALFAGSLLDARVVPGPPGAASAVKVAYAAWTKGTAALLLAVRALARAEGVEEALVAEWALSQPSLPDRYASATRSAGAKGWRWIGEMEQIASAMEADGLPGGFHQAAADIYRSWPDLGRR